jgi:glucose-1-phosphate thymidylyltransferase
METRGLVLAAGRDESLRALLPAANRPILAHVVAGMARAGIEQVAVVGPENAAAELVSAAEAPVSFIPGAPGVAAALAAGEEFLGEAPFVLQQGDGVLLDDLAPLVRDLRGDAMVLVHRVAKSPPPIGDAHELLRLLGDAVAPGPGLAVAGAHLIGAGALARVRAGLGDGAGVSAEMRMVAGWQACRDGGDDLLELNRVMLDALAPSGATELPDCVLQGRVEIDPSATVRSSVIRGPVAIGPGAQIIDAYLGPYTSVGAGVCIENAEIENSVVHAGARIQRVGGRLEASVIGRDARVHRDFALPRALRMHIGDRAEVALA